MRKIHLAVASLALAAGLLGSGTASAQDKSQHGGGYVQGNVLGFSVITTCVNAGIFGSVCASGGAYHMDFEGGYHLSGTQDGIVLGLRQGLNFASGGVIAATQGKFGYGIVFPISGGPSELVVEPYTVLGAAYGSGDPRFAFGFGADVRFFPNESGLFVGGHPLEVGGWVPGGFVYTFAAGGGYAF